VAKRPAGLERVLFPESGFTRAEAVDYYRRIARVLLPHLRNRPISFKRYPDSVRNESFWEKDAPSFTPVWVKRFSVPRRGEESTIDYLVVNDVRTLTWIAGVGGIELHPFLHRIPHIDRATQIVFDLDPGPGAGLAECCEVALVLREALQALGLKAFPKVSGSKGVQVYVPLNGHGIDHDVTETFARLLAEQLARAHPKQIVAKMDKSVRRNKVFIDWSQNADYKTTVAVYSLRTKREQPYVSMPVMWEEIEAAEDLEWTPDEALARVAKLGDVFAPVLTTKQTLPGIASTHPATRAKVSTRRDATTLPKPKSQSGRRLFVLTKTETGNELWLDMQGKFKRWLLRPDREGSDRLIAMPAGDIPIDPAYYAGRVPAAWKDRVAIEDTGAYEVIGGSYAAREFALWFSGKVLAGEWRLGKVSEDPRHRSWLLEPRKA
jgi:bifunctional non-homologous end joining protein LigD